MVTLISSSKYSTRDPSEFDFVNHTSILLLFLVEKNVMLKIINSLSTRFYLRICLTDDILSGKIQPGKFK